MNVKFSQFPKIPVKFRKHVLVSFGRLFYLLTIIFNIKIKKIKIKADFSELHQIPYLNSVPNFIIYLKYFLLEDSGNT